MHRRQKRYDHGKKICGKRQEIRCIPLYDNSLAAERDVINETSEEMTIVLYLDRLMLRTKKYVAEEQAQQKNSS